MESVWHTIVELGGDSAQQPACVAKTVRRKARRSSILEAGGAHPSPLQEEEPGS